MSITAMTAYLGSYKRAGKPVVGVIAPRAHPCGRLPSALSTMSKGAVPLS